MKRFGASAKIPRSALRGINVEAFFRGFRGWSLCAEGGGVLWATKVMQQQNFEIIAVVRGQGGRYRGAEWSGAV